jgi:hypothetical protein
MKKINFLKLVFIVSNNTVHIIPDKHGAARGGEACALRYIPQSGPCTLMGSVAARTLGHAYSTSRISLISAALKLHKHQCESAARRAPGSGSCRTASINFLKASAPTPAPAPRVYTNIRELNGQIPSAPRDRKKRCYP